MRKTTGGVKVYGLDLLRRLNEDQMRKLTLEGIGGPIDWARAETDPGYVLDIFDAAPVSSLEAMEQLSGQDFIDWPQLQNDAGEGYVLQSWVEEIVETEAQAASAEAAGSDS